MVSRQPHQWLAEWLSLDGRLVRGTEHVLTLADILTALHPDGSCELGCDVAITELCVDSREARKGVFFVAMRGEHVDGHMYVLQAIGAGAVGALVSEPVAGLPLVEVGAGVSALPAPPWQVLVADTLAALQQIARWLRQKRADLTVVGVTGSVGKTTTKEAIAAVLGQRFAILKNPGNRNNEIGLPLTLSQLEPRHRFAVLEMGMYDLGEIALLCDMARPQVGIVTNVGPTHLERLGSMERIAQAKAELVQALPSDGVAVLNGDDPCVAAMASLTSARIMTLGTAGAEKAHTVSASQVTTLGLAGCEFTASVRAEPSLGLVGGERRVRTAMLGAHAVEPALFAIAVGLLAGLEWPEIDDGLRALGPGPRLVPRAGRGGTLILDDTYNSSPASCHAALDALGQLPGRHVVVLGDMLELGTVEQAGHLEVGRHCAAVADHLVTVGQRARGIAEGALEAGLAAARIATVANSDQALACLETLLMEGDVLLIKASRGMALEPIVAALRQESHEDQ